MYAEMFETKCRQYVDAAHGFRDKLAGQRTDDDAGSRAQAGTVPPPHYACRNGFVPWMVSGVVVAMFVVGATYLAAASLVAGAVSHSHTFASHAMVLRQAAANYRLARAQCQRVAEGTRGACIAEAHAEEGRARAVALLAPKGHMAGLRTQTDAAIDAGDRDSIVIEPACSVVARGQAGVCEIQVNSDTVKKFAAAEPRRL